MFSVIDRIDLLWLVEFCMYSISIGSSGELEATHAGLSDISSTRLMDIPEVIKRS